VAQLPVTASGHRVAEDEVPGGSQSIWSITWELDRNAECWPYPRPAELEILVWGPTSWGLTSPPGDSHITGLGQLLTHVAIRAAGEGLRLAQTRNNWKIPDSSGCLRDWERSLPTPPCQKKTTMSFSWKLEGREKATVFLSLPLAWFQFCSQKAV